MTTDTGRIYWNEFDDAAATWIENLIADGELPRGVVDRRSIRDVEPADLVGFTQCHFFAGIGGWSLAARLARWPSSAELWTGSCPCQPFSAAGNRMGVDDPRHLWPDFFRLIRARRPARVVGEQVAGAPGYGWLDGVLADLEGEGYAGRAVDIPALAVNRPHQRNRTYWVAVDRSSQGYMADGPRRERGRRADLPRWRSIGGASPVRDDSGERGAGRIGYGVRPRLEGLARDGDGAARREIENRYAPAANVGEFIICHDGKARRIPYGGFPMLVNGISGRVAVRRSILDNAEGFEGEEVRHVSRIAAWRGFGNAIVPDLAAEVLAALAETTGLADGR